MKLKYNGQHVMRVGQKLAHQFRTTTKSMYESYPVSADFTTDTNGGKRRKPFSPLRVAQLDPFNDELNALNRWVRS